MSFDVHRLASLGRVGSFAHSPDGSWLAVVVGRADDEGASYRDELWRAPLDGAEPSRIGAGAFSDGQPRFRPDGALLFTSDRTEADHGEEDRADKDSFRQVWARHPDGRLEQLTDEPLGVKDYRVADGGRLVLLASALPGVPHAAQRATALDRRKRGPSLLHYRDMPIRHWDHWLGEARSRFVQLDPDGRRTTLTPDADREYDVDVDWDLSADGRQLVATTRRIGAERIPLSALQWFELDTGARKVLGLEPGRSCFAPRFSPDGRTVAAGIGTLDADGIGEHHLALFDLRSGERRLVATHWDRWPLPATWVDSRTVLCLADDQGSVPVFAVGTEDGGVRRVAPDAASYRDIEVVGDRVFAVRHALLAPPEVVSLPLAGGPPTWHTELAGIDRAELEALATVETHGVPSSDGAEVPLFLVRPRATADGPRPALLWIHGGPRSQWGETWHWRWNSLVAISAGYTVALPNPRGSTGLGQAWADAIGGNTWGGQCYRDVMAIADHLATREDVDGERMCAMGGSFGGYMTNWIGTQTDRFRCLITHASIFSFHMFGLTTDLPAFWRVDLQADPWTDREALERYSPDMAVQDWKSPVLVIHGDKDYRVPIGEGLALFEALRRHGVDAELAVFPDENHWILKPRNVVAWYELVLDYLGRHMTSDGEDDG